VLVITGTDYTGFSKALLSFPMSSGITIPDWIITGPTYGWKGAGGLKGAGFWGNKWEFLPEMSYLTPYVPTAQYFSQTPSTDTSTLVLVGVLSGIGGIALTIISYFMVIFIRKRKSRGYTEIATND